MTEPSLIGEAIGNYVVRAQVGEGGMGVVYRADHRRLSRAVAVKVLRPDTSRNPELVRRFFNEARAASELRHPHVVEVLDFGELADGQSYIVMEWLDGQSLSQALQTAGRFSIERAVGVLSGICEALAGAHARGIVHRDLKPDNVYLIERQGNPDFVKVLDFGIAKLEAPGELRNTRAGAMLGTPSYMSPEQGLGAHDADHRSDIYSLGVITFELVTGVLPFRCENFAEMILAHQMRPPPRPSELVPEVPAWVDAITARSLAKTPDQRYQNVSELHADILRMGGTRLPTPYGERRASSNPFGHALPVPPEPSGPVHKPTSLLPSTIPGATEIGRASPTPPPPRPTRWVWPVLVVGLALGVGYFGLRDRLLPGAVVTPPADVRVIIAPSRADAVIKIDGATVPNPYIYLGPAQPGAREVIITAPGAREHREVVSFGQTVERRPVLTALPVEDKPPQERAEREGRDGTDDKTAGGEKREPSDRPVETRPGSAREGGKREVKHPAKADRKDPLKSESPLLDGLNEFMRNRPKPQKQDFPK